MIDFIKATIPPTFIPMLKANTLLHWIGSVSHSTGEISENCVATYHGLKFQILKNRYVQLSGSLHKFKNEGLHNADSFSFEAFILVFQKIEELFGVPLQAMRLLNLEFGLNLSLPFSLSIVTNSLLLHKGTPFKDILVHKNGSCRVAPHQQYNWKIYDKSAQFSSAMGHILRIEIHVSKMKFLKKHGILFLSDISTESFNLMHKMLLTEWNNTLLIDPGLLGSSIFQNNSMWAFPDYWKGLKKQGRYKQTLKMKKASRMYGWNLQNLVMTIINGNAELCCPSGDLLTV